MGNLFSEEEKDDGYGHMATYGRYLRHMEAQRDYSSDDTRDGSYTQHGGQSYNRVSDSDDTGDDGRSQHAYVQSNNVVHYNEDELANRAIKALERAAESSPIKSGTKGRSLFLSLRGGREAVLALMDKWHPDLLHKMVLKNDGFPDARYREFKMLMKVLGQYVPIFTKAGNLDKKCRTYKVLMAAGIDFDKMSLSESQLMIKKLHYFGNDTRLTATLRLAHSVKWYNSLVDDEKPGGHVNALLVLSGLKNLKQRKQELQDERRRQEEEWERQRQREDFERRCQEEEYERQREDFELRCQEEEYERRCQEEEDYERRRQEEYERELQEGEEYERQRRQEEEYERQRQEEEDYERRRQEEEYERQRQEEEYEQRYYGTVVSIKKNHAHGNEYAFVDSGPRNIFLHPSDMRYREWVDVGDQIEFSVGYFNGRRKCMDVVLL